MNSFDFVHAVFAKRRAIEVFVYHSGKVVESTLVELVPGAVWRTVCGPGMAVRMWDHSGAHFVRGSEPCPGARLDLDDPARLLDARQFLARKGSRPRLRLVELWAGKGRVSGAVAAQGRTAMKVGYAWGQDFSRLEHRRDVHSLLDRSKPGTALCAPQCKDWSPWHNVNAARIEGFAERLRLRRLRQLPIIRWMCRLLIAQLRRGGEIIVENPRRSKMWKLLCIRRFIRLARDEGFELDFIDVDQCAYGLRDPASLRRFQKSTRFLVSRPGRFSNLARKCRCRRAHEPLAGSTKFLGRTVRKTRLAECYPTELARALADVIAK